MRRILSYGMIGGGPGALIGGGHRLAARFEGKAELVAGCFSRSYDKTLETGGELRLDEDRLYRDYETMARMEGEREDGIDFVAITTPNHTHYPIARAFMESGIHIVCDKPLTHTVEQAEELAAMAEERDLLFCVTYTYSGYPMVKQAREMIRSGELGEIRVVMGEYPQDWLATPAEREGVKQAEWRTDPERSGRSNCIGDIGSHIENTVSYMTGLEIESLCANLDTFVEGRPLDDNGEVLIRFRGGATGVYWASQVAVGAENDLKVRVYGTRGSIEWEQKNPNYMKVVKLGEPEQVYGRGHDYLGQAAVDNTRTPPGHPEGFFEAFANIYTNFASALLKKKAGEEPDERDLDFPDVHDGLQGVRFINRCVDSSEQGAMWVDFE